VTILKSPDAVATGWQFRAGAGCRGETGIKSETEVKLAHGSAEPCARKGASVRLAEKANNASGQLFLKNPLGTRVSGHVQDKARCRMYGEAMQRRPGLFLAA